MLKKVIDISFLALFLCATTVYSQVYLRDSGGSLLLTNIPQPDYIRLKKFKKAHKDEYKKMAQKAALKYGLSYELLDAVIETESGYNPQAISCKGAQGLMQLMPTTADALKVNNAFDPEENIDAGARYLKAMVDRYGSVELALAAYNAGPKAVDKYKDIPPYRETQGYVKKIKGKVGGFPDSASSRQHGVKKVKTNKVKVKKNKDGSVFFSN